MRSEAVAESASLVGQCFAERYELEARIGSGAAGETYRARHVDQPRAVAVKVFYEDVADDAVRQRRFELEMSKLTALEHPSMPAILAFGVHAGRRFVVREWLEGETLAERLARGPVSLEVAMTIARQVLAALAPVHGARLLHRALHPSNVFLETRKHGGERVKLLDFAPVARTKRQATPYRAPEDVAGDPLDARSDVFAIGALVSAMLRPAVSDAASTSAAGASATHAADDRSSRPVSDTHSSQGAFASAAVVAVLSAGPASAAAGAALPPDTGHDHGERALLNSASGGFPVGSQLAAHEVRRASQSRRRADVESEPAGPVVIKAARASGSELSAVQLPAAAVATAERVASAHPAPDQLVSAFETAFAPPALVAPETPPPAPVAETENPLQRWIGRALAEDRSERFDDAADMLRELVDRLPRELRVAADEAARTRRSPVALDGPASADSGASDTEAAAAATSLSPAKPQSPRTTPRLTTEPVTHSNGAEALPEVDPVALHGPGEPGMSQLTAATAFGAFAFAAIVIIVMPGELGRAHRVPVAPRARVAQPVAPPRTETRVETAKKPGPPSLVPLSAIAPLAPLAPTRRVSISPPKAAAPVAVARTRPLSEARDPWLDPLPNELKRFRASALSGSAGDKATIEALRVYSRTNAKDPRGYLIAARFYLNRLWRTDGVGQYAAALERDPSVRGAPEILPALLECVAEGKAAPAAEALIEKVYGTGATPAIDRALDKIKSQTAAVRLSTLSEKLLAKSP